MLCDKDDDRLDTLKICDSTSMPPLNLLLKSGSTYLILTHLTAWVTAPCASSAGTGSVRRYLTVDVQRARLRMPLVACVTAEREQKQRAVALRGGAVACGEWELRPETDVFLCGISRCKPSCGRGRGAEVDDKIKSKHIISTSQVELNLGTRPCARRRQTPDNSSTRL